MIAAVRCRAGEGQRMSDVRVALIGDYRSEVTAHVAIPESLELAAKTLDARIDPVWIHTSKLTGNQEMCSLLSYHGIWCVPGSPYANTDGVISAISVARTQEIPFLGTCAG